MAVTIKDIAAAVGLSHVTVSKVLRNTGNISEATRKRVLEVADQMRYRPHGIAKSMRDGRTGIIGMIYSAEGSSRSITTPQLIGIQTALAKVGYELMLGLLPRAALAEPGNTTALLRQWMADGLLINHHIGLPPKVAQLVEGDHVPAIWMNSRHTINSVYFDDIGGAVAAVRHLSELGHRNITYVDLSHPVTGLRGDEHYSIADRHDGYVQEMEARGLTPRVWMPEVPMGACERIRFLRERYRASAPKPTALISYGHQTETAFLAAEERLSVPGDLSLISFGGEPQYLNDRRSTQIFLPYQDLGRTAVERLMLRIQGAQAASIALPLKVLPGDSTSVPGGS